MHKRSVTCTYGTDKMAITTETLPSSIKADHTRCKKVSQVYRDRRSPRPWHAERHSAARMPTL